LTIARYYTPTGRSIQKSFKKGHEAYFKESESRFLSGELYAKDSIKIADSLKFKTPKGRILYGGGGIVPDVFVPITNTNTDLNFVLQSGAVGDFVFEILDKNRAYFESLNFDSLMNKIENTNRYFDLFQSFVSKKVVLIDISKNKKEVNLQLKAEFARQLFGEKQYYEVLVKEDEMVKKILKKMNLNYLGAK
jgi:carboxyl-terminal processing protease